MSTIKSLQEQIKKLEKRVSNLESKKPNSASADLDFDSSAAPSRPSKDPGVILSFWTWLKQDWLMKLGAFLILLGLAWFVTYAIINDWLGPVARISLGILAGVGVMAVGHFSIKKYSSAGKVLIAVGAIGLLLTLFAGRYFYQYFNPPLLHLFLMAFVILSGSILATLHNSLSLANTMLIGGAIVPILVRTPRFEADMFSAYVFLLGVGAAYIAFSKGWRSMVLLSLIISGLYSVGFDYLATDSLKWIFMGGFFVLYLASNIAAIFRSKSVQLADLFITTINGLLLLAWIFAFVPSEWISLILSAVVVLLTLISSKLLSLNKLSSTLLYSGLGVLFLGAATAHELQGNTLLIALSIEVLLAVVLSRAMFPKTSIPNFVSLLQIIPVFLTLMVLEGYSMSSEVIFSAEFFAVLVSITSLTVTAFVIKQRDFFPVFKLINGLFALAFGMSLIWIVSHQLFDSHSVSRGVALVIYCLFGLSSWVYSVYSHRKALKIISNLLLAGVVFRLIFYEVWLMNLEGRILTFVIIGILLVSTPFLEKRKITK